MTRSVLFLLVFFAFKQTPENFIDFVGPDAARTSVGSLRQSDLLKALTDQTRPVLYSIAHKAAVDVVELPMVCPICLHVVDFKAYVGRYPMGLSTLVDMDEARRMNLDI